MTVKELIEKLKECNEDKVVVLNWLYGVDEVIDETDKVILTFDYQNEG